MSKTKNPFHWFYRFSRVHNSPVCFTLPARTLHARTQVTVYHSKLGHYLLSLPNASSSFLVYVNISFVLQFYRNEDQWTWNVFISVSSAVPHFCILFKWQEDVNCQTLHSNIPAIAWDVFCYNLYYLLMQFIEFASRGLTLPKVVFKTFPANGMRYILLYYLLMQFIQFASGGLTLPKLVFKTFPANGMRCFLLYYLFPQAVYWVC